MSYKDQSTLLDSLLEKGFINEEIKQNLLLSFNDYVQNLANNEVKLLEEISIIQEKKKRNEILTDLENTFWNFFIKSYSIS